MARSDYRAARRNDARGSGKPWQVAFARPQVVAVKLNRSAKLPVAHSYAQAARIAQINHESDEHRARAAADMAARGVVTEGTRI